jgi:hypothetical protein
MPPPAKAFFTGPERMVPFLDRINRLATKAAAYTIREVAGFAVGLVKANLWGATYRRGHLPVRRVTGHLARAVSLRRVTPLHYRVFMASEKTLLERPTKRRGVTSYDIIVHEGWRKGQGVRTSMPGRPYFRQSIELAERLFSYKMRKRYGIAVNQAWRESRAARIA